MKDGNRLSMASPQGTKKRNQLADTVRVKHLDPISDATLSWISPFRAPLINKRRVYHCREIELQDPYENMGAQLTGSVSKTNDVASDGNHHSNCSGSGHGKRRHEEPGQPAQTQS